MANEAKSLEQVVAEVAQAEQAAKEPAAPAAAEPKEVKKAFDPTELYAMMNEKFEQVNSSLARVNEEVEGVKRAKSEPAASPAKKGLNEEELRELFLEDPYEASKIYTKQMLESERKLMQEQVRADEARRSFDHEAELQFPELKQPQSNFYKEVKKTVDEMTRAGMDFNNPRLVYDAAMITFGKLAKSGEIQGNKPANQPAKTERAGTILGTSSRTGQPEQTGGDTRQTIELDVIQKEVCQLLKVSEADYIKQLEKERDEKLRREQVLKGLGGY